jgi:RNA polymerase sigma factor (sigma-70 family)
MDRDTDMGGSGRRFPATRLSVLLAARDPTAEVRAGAFEALVAAYWKPVYKYLRIKWGAGNEDAQDLTQGFFALAYEKGFFERYDPALARFRTYLRTCLDGFVANQRKAAQRLKRGGGALTLSLDFEDAEGELAPRDVPDPLDMEEYFHREWVRHLVERAVETLRERCRAQGKDTPYQLFVRYDLEGPEAGERVSYAQLAIEFGLPATQVTNHLAWARRELRRILLDTLREVTASEEEFRAEARLVLGVGTP